MSKRTSGSLKSSLSSISKESISEDESFPKHLVFLLLAECLLAVAQGLFHHQVRDLTNEEKGVKSIKEAGYLEVATFVSAFTIILLASAADSAIGMFYLWCAGNGIFLGGSITLVTHFATDPETEISKQSLAISKYICVLYECMFPIELLFLMKQLILPDKFKHLMHTCCFVLLAKFTAYVVAYFAIIDYMQQTKRVSLFACGLQILIVVGYLVFLIVTKKQLVNEQFKLLIVEQILKCCGKALWNKLRRKIKASRWVDNAVDEDESIRNLTSNSISLIIFFSTLIVFYLCRSLLFTVWSQQNLEMVQADWPYYYPGNDIKVAVFNIIHIIVLHFIIFPLLRMIFQFRRNEIRYLAFAHMFMICSLTSALIVQGKLNKEPFIEPTTGSAQIRIYGTFLQPTTLTSIWTGTLTVVGFRISNISHISASGRIYTSINIFNRIANYTKPLIAYENRATAYLVTYNGLTKVSGFEPYYINRRNLMANFIVINSIEDKKNLSIHLQNKEGDYPFSFECPTFGNRVYFELQPNLYTINISDVDTNYSREYLVKDYHPAAIYSFIVYLDHNSLPAIYKTTLWHRTRVSEHWLLPSIYFYSLANSLEIMAIPHLIAKDMSVDILSTVGSCWYFYNGLGGLIFYFHAANVFSIHTNTILIYIALEVINLFYHLYSTTLYYKATGKLSDDVEED